MAHGIGARYVAKAILDAEEAGIVIAHRGGMRVATTYTLTWLPLHDGSPPDPAWKEFTARPSAGGLA